MKYTRKQVEEIFNRSPAWQIDLIMIEPGWFISPDREGRPSFNPILGPYRWCGEGWKLILKGLLMQAKAYQRGYDEYVANKELPEEDRYPSSFDPEMEKYKENPFGPDGFRVDQIKEKFGGLRFYYGGGTPEFGNMSSFAEALSYITCERCGAEGTQNETGWIKTYCKKCHEEVALEQLKRIRGEHAI